ncbi:MAG TPA: hypothetical protein GXX70_02130 [Tepidimicrobium sp.]|nr:hypothetical protein [Tepidimicrobium sp.]
MKNFGHDGSGVHGGELIDSPYMKIEIDSDESFDFKGDPIFDHPKYLEQVKGGTKVPFIRKIKFWLRVYKYPIQLFKIIYTLNIGSKRVNVE